MRRLNSWKDALTNKQAILDTGDGVLATLPLDPAPYDSGWRQVAPAAGVTGNIFIRRHGQFVVLMAHSAVSTAAGTITLCSIASGFQPRTISGANWRNGVLMDDAATTIRMASYFSGNMRILNAEANKAYGGTIMWLTSDPIPATLPGTPA